MAHRDQDAHPSVVRPLHQLFTAAKTLLRRGQVLFSHKVQNAPQASQKLPTAQEPKGSPETLDSQKTPCSSAPVISVMNSLPITPTVLSQSNATESNSTQKQSNLAAKATTLSLSRQGLNLSPELNCRTSNQNQTTLTPVGQMQNKITTRQGSSAQKTCATKAAAYPQEEADKLKGLRQEQPNFKASLDSDTNTASDTDTDTYGINSQSSLGAPALDSSKDKSSLFSTSSVFSVSSVKASKLRKASPSFATLRNNIFASTPYSPEAHFVVGENLMSLTTLGTFVIPVRSYSDLISTQAGKMALLQRMADVSPRVWQGLVLPMLEGCARICTVLPASCEIHSVFKGSMFEHSLNLAMTATEWILLTDIPAKSKIPNFLREDSQDMEIDIRTLRNIFNTDLDQQFYGHLSQASAYRPSAENTAQDNALTQEQVDSNGDTACENESKEDESSAGTANFALFAGFSQQSPAVKKFIRDNYQLLHDYAEHFSNVQGLKQANLLAQWNCYLPNKHSFCEDLVEPALLNFEPAYLNWRYHRQQLSESLVAMPAFTLNDFAAMSELPQAQCRSALECLGAYERYYFNSTIDANFFLDLNLGLKVPEVPEFNKFMDIAMLLEDGNPEDIITETTAQVIAPLVLKALQQIKGAKPKFNQNQQVLCLEIVCIFLALANYLGQIVAKMHISAATGEEFCPTQENLQHFVERTKTPVLYLNPRYQPFVDNRSYLSQGVSLLAHECPASMAFIESYIDLYQAIQGELSDCPLGKLIQVADCFVATFTDSTNFTSNIISTFLADQVSKNYLYTRHYLQEQAIFCKIKQLQQQFPCSKAQNKYVIARDVQTTESVPCLKCQALNKLDSNTTLQDSALDLDSSLNAIPQTQTLEGASWSSEELEANEIEESASTPTDTDTDISTDDLSSTQPPVTNTLATEEVASTDTAKASDNEESWPEIQAIAVTQERAAQAQADEVLAQIDKDSDFQNQADSTEEKEADLSSPQVLTHTQATDRESYLSKESQYNWPFNQPTCPDTQDECTCWQEPCSPPRVSISKDRTWQVPYPSKRSGYMSANQDDYLSYLGEKKVPQTSTYAEGSLRWATSCNIKTRELEYSPLGEWAMYSIKSYEPISVMNAMEPLAHYFGYLPHSGPCRMNLLTWRKMRSSLNNLYSGMFVTPQGVFFHNESASLQDLKVQCHKLEFGKIHNQDGGVEVDDQAFIDALNKSNRAISFSLNRTCSQEYVVAIDNDIEICQLTDFVFNTQDITEHVPAVKLQLISDEQGQQIVKFLLETNLIAALKAIKESFLACKEHSTTVSKAPAEKHELDLSKIILQVMDEQDQEEITPEEDLSEQDKLEVVTEINQEQDSTAAQVKLPEPPTTKRRRNTKAKTTTRAKSQAKSKSTASTETQASAHSQDSLGLETEQELEPTAAQASLPEQPTPTKSRRNTKAKTTTRAKSQAKSKSTASTEAQASAHSQDSLGLETEQEQEATATQASLPKQPTHTKRRRNKLSQVQTKTQAKTKTKVRTKTQDKSDVALEKAQGNSLEIEDTAEAKVQEESDFVASDMFAEQDILLEDNDLEMEPTTIKMPKG